MKIIRRARPRFTGWTEADGSQKASAPAHWPFGTVPKPNVQKRVNRKPGKVVEQRADPPVDYDVGEARW